MCLETITLNNFICEKEGGMGEKKLSKCMRYCLAFSK